MHKPCSADGVSYELDTTSPARVSKIFNMIDSLAPYQTLDCRSLQDIDSLLSKVPIATPAAFACEFDIKSYKSP